MVRGRGNLLLEGHGAFGEHVGTKHQSFLQPQNHIRNATPAPDHDHQHRIPVSRVILGNKTRIMSNSNAVWAGPSNQTRNNDSMSKVGETRNSTQVTHQDASASPYGEQQTRYD